jgi:group I intron endonuclease
MYLIYRLTAPSGRFYIGITNQTLEQRWYFHVRKALKEEANYPLHNSIRKYGPESFELDVLAAYEDEDEALQAEVFYIHLTQARTKGYNISEGGEYDSQAGIEKLAKLRLDPKFEADYRAKLSAGCLASEAHRNHALKFGEVTLQWRAENVRMAYKMSYRAMRMALRAQGIPRGERRDPRFTKYGGRLWMGSPKVTNARANYGRADRTREQWATMPEAQKKQVHRQISESTKLHHAQKSPEERAAHDAQLAEARKNINQDLRKARQKAALIAYWTPERRAAKTAALKALWTPERRLAQSKATRTAKSKRPPMTS